MGWRRREAWVMVLGALAGLSLILAGPALGRIAQARLVAALEHGISGSVTYKITNEGHDVGQTTTGVVGQGTISGKLSLGARLSATLLGAVRGVPISAITSGGSYVVRYDVDAKGDHKGLVVITFKAPGVGRLCVGFTAAYGKFVPGKADYVPSTETFKTIGGSGEIAKVRASGQVSQGEVTGSSIEQILGSGSVLSLTRGSASPLSGACSAVAKLARPG